MTGLARCFDAAFPPPSPPTNAVAALGYIGSDFPDPVRLDRDFHIWTASEWLTVQHLRQFPAWECNPAKSATASAADAVSEMREWGWSFGRALVAAMETFIAPDWWAAFEGAAESVGMWPVCYGSESTVYQNNAKRYWLALYDQIPTIPTTNPPTLAKQYLSTGTLDWSVVAPELMSHAGIGPRRQRP